MNVLSYKKSHVQIGFVGTEHRGLESESKKAARRRTKQKPFPKIRSVDVNGNKLDTFEVMLRKELHTDMRGKDRNRCSAPAMNNSGS